MPTPCRQPGGDDEAHAVEERTLSGRQLGAVGVAVEDARRAPTRMAATASGGRNSDITASPRRIAEAAIPTSTPGSGTPRSPSIPPSAITIGKATGRSQSAGSAELRAPEAHRDHRQDVIQPRHGVTEAGHEARRLPFRSVSVSRRSPGEDGMTAMPDFLPLPRHLVFGIRLIAPVPSRMATRWIVQKAPKEPTV